MARQTCQICGHRNTPDTMEQHHVVPTEVTAPTDIPESQTLRLCANCHREVHSWYRSKVAQTTYDLNIKRFRPRSDLELVREYQAVFNNYLKYKAEQDHRTVPG